jgi:hypothetical protein
MKDLGMNRPEWVVFGIACATLFGYLLWRFRQWSLATLALVVCAFPLYLSLERTSQFLTTDERGMLFGYLQPCRHQTVEEHWKLGAFRTSLLTIAPVLRNIEPSPQWPVVEPVVRLKLVHWATGLVLFLWISHLGLRLWPESDQAVGFVLIFCTLLLLPTDPMALKTFNYDLLSLGFGVLAVLTLLIALREARPRLALAAVALAYLAAQEKLIASPILLAAITTFAYLKHLQRQENRGAALNRLRALALVFANVFEAVFLALTIGIVSMLAVWWLLKLPAVSWPQRIAFAADPLVSWTWVVLRFTLGVTDFTSYSVWLVALSGILCVAGVLGLLVVKRVQRPAFAESIRNHSVLLTGIVLLLALVAGIVADYTVRAYWAPFKPIAEVNYHPPGAINGTVTHFETATLARHIACFVGYAYAVFTDAIPSILWLLTGVIGIAAWRRTRLVAGDLQLALLGCLVVPCGFGLLQISIGHRYLNLFLALFALIIAGQAALVLSSATPRVRWLLCAGAVALLVAEIYPFRPFFGPFRPFWLNYPDATTPCLGRINPSWLGWGEEVMLASERLEKLSAAPTQRPRLFALYDGEWVKKNPPIEEHLLLQTPAAEIGYTDHDYFLMNRTFVICGAARPEAVKPEFVLSFRGFEQAWVYRGDRVQAAGYAWDPSYSKYGGFVRLGSHLAAK